MTDPNYLGNIAQAAARKKLAAGQKLTYRPGQGYYAAPVSVAKAAVTKPPVSPTQPTAPFDYKKALLGEGIYQGDAANAQAAANDAQIQRDNGVKALNFQFNDPNNPYSTMGELGRQLKETNGMFQANRAARGVQTSGGTTLGAMQIGHQYGKDVYDATNQHLGQIGQLDSQLAGAQRQSALDTQQALAAAYQRLIENGVGPAEAAAQAKASVGGNAAAAGGGLGTAPGAAPGPGGFPVDGQTGMVGGGWGGPQSGESYPQYAARTAAADAADRQQNPQNWVRYPDGTWADLRGAGQEARTQALMNAQGYQTMFLGTREATWRKLAPGQKYTEEMHLQDLAKSGRTKPGWDGYDQAGRPLPGAANAAKRKAAEAWKWGRGLV